MKTVDAGTGPTAMRTVEALGDVIRIMMMAAGHGSRAHLTLITLPKPTLGAIGTRADSNFH